MTSEQQPLAQQQQAEIVNPLVFQCSNCKVIVGDSFSWLLADQELNALTLTSCSAVVSTDPEVQFSSDGPDSGSVFQSLKCSGCALTVGKVYRSTPRKWDGIRDSYTFNLDLVSSYQLGVDSPVTNDQLHQDDESRMPSAMEINAKFSKLQTAILHLNDRIDHLSTAADSTAKTPRRRQEVSPACSTPHSIKQPRISKDENKRHSSNRV